MEHENDKENIQKAQRFIQKQVVLATLRQNSTIAEICQQFGVVESQVYKWRNQALANMEEAFAYGKKLGSEVHEQEIARLHQKIGKLTVERDFLEHAWSRYQSKKEGV